MEIGTQHKYGFNILLDFKPAESPMRPETAEIMRQRAASLDADTCGTVYGFPLADLLAKPIKIIQSPRVSASEALRVIERFHDLLADADLFETFCNQNEKDAAHMPKK